MPIVTKNGIDKEVKDRFLWKSLADGWTLKGSSPKAKIVTGKATVKPVEPVTEVKVEDILPEVETDSNQSFDANIKGD